MYPGETLNMVKHAYLIMETATLSFYLGAKQQYDLLLSHQLSGSFSYFEFGIVSKFCFSIKPI